MECSCGSSITASSLATFLVTSTAWLALLALRDRRQRIGRENELSLKLDAMNAELLNAVQGRRLFGDSPHANRDSDPEWLLDGDTTGTDAIFNRSVTSRRGLQQAISGLRQEVVESHATVSRKVDDLAANVFTLVRDSTVGESQSTLEIPRKQVHPEDKEEEEEEDAIMARFRREHGAALSIQRNWRGFVARAELTTDRELSLSGEEQAEAEISERAAIATELYALREQDPTWSEILRLEARFNRSAETLTETHHEDLFHIPSPAKSRDAPDRQEHVHETRQSHGFRSCDVDWCFQKENTRDLPSASVVNMTAEEVVQNQRGLKQSTRI